MNAPGARVAFRPQHQHGSLLESRVFLVQRPNQVLVGTSRCRLAGQIPQRVSCRTVHQPSLMSAGGVESRTEPRGTRRRNNIVLPQCGETASPDSTIARRPQPDGLWKGAHLCAECHGTSADCR